jgi:SAM-dependent methyltransferase
MLTRYQDAVTLRRNVKLLQNRGAVDAIDMRISGKLIGAIREWDRGAICLAALAVAADGGAAGSLATAAGDVMAAAGLEDALAFPERLPLAPRQLRGMAASPLLQAAALVDGPDEAWNAHSDSTLTAQGEASGSAAALFARFVLPHTGDLADRLAQPGARMLDVGTGVGALAVGFAQTFPHLHVTGIDIMPRVLDIARARVRSSEVGSRVELRLQDVAELSDVACYDLVWVPAPFVPEPALRAGIPRAVTALRPGGLLMLGHGSLEGTDLDVAITRFKTVAYGGTALDGPSAVNLLDQHGLTSAQTVPTPPGAPRITVGRR